MGYFGDDNIFEVPTDIDDCSSDLERAALEAGAAYYADSADAAAWWINYVEGVNATGADCEDLSDELYELEDLHGLAVAYLGEEQAEQAHDLVSALIESLKTGSAGNHETERAVFLANLDELREAMAKVA
jgi:hypothetical protein